jgi:hypothetical protein
VREHHRGVSLSSRWRGSGGLRVAAFTVPACSVFAAISEEADDGGEGTQDGAGDGRAVPPHDVQAAAFRARQEREML